MNTFLIKIQIPHFDRTAVSKNLFIVVAIQKAKQLTKELFNLIGKINKNCELCWTEFYVLSTVHPGMILVNNQLGAQFFMYVYFYSIHVSGSHVPIIRRIIVSMRHLVYVTLCRRPPGMHHLHTRRSSTQGDINQVSHWYNNSPDDGNMAARNM